MCVQVCKGRDWQALVGAFGCQVVEVGRCTFFAQYVTLFGVQCHSPKVGPFLQIVQTGEVCMQGSVLVLRLTLPVEQAVILSFNLPVEQAVILGLNLPVEQAVILSFNLPVEQAVILRLNLPVEQAVILRLTLPVERAVILRPTLPVEQAVIGKNLHLLFSEVT